ncbi:MAG: hypothetical protein ACREOO_16540 [bacterium]
MRLWKVATFVIVLLGATQMASAQSGVALTDSNAIVSKSQGQDQWLGKDKFDHFAASAFVAGAQYYVLHGELEQSHTQSLGIAIASTLALGVAKEIYDGVSKRGTPSFKDIVADALGIAFAAVLLSR